MFHDNVKESDLRKAEQGKAVVIVLVLLVLVAVGALAYLSTQMKDETGEAAAVASAESDTATTEEATATEEAAATQEPAAGSEETADAKKDDEAADEPKTATADGIKIEEGNPIVAKVDGKDISRVDILNYIQTMPPQMRQAPLPQLFDMAQEQVINTKIMDEKIDTEKLANDEEVQKQLENAKQQIIRSVYLQREIESKLTDKRIDEAYNKFKKEFGNVEEVKARHILVADEAKAKELIKKLDEGADFAELAKENSTDGTAVNGGELGFFSQTDVVPEFANAAFALKKGAYTKEPVKTQFGYHVIEQEDKRKRPTPELKDVKPMLESNLRREILEETMKKWRDAAKVEKFDINGKEIAKGDNN